MCRPEPSRCAPDLKPQARAAGPCRLPQPRRARLNAATSRCPRPRGVGGGGRRPRGSWPPHSTPGALIYFGIMFNCFLLVEALTCEACKSDPKPPYGALVFHFQMHSPCNNDGGITQFEFCCRGLYYIMLSN